LTEAMLRADIETCAALYPDGTLNPLQFAAWLVQQRPSAATSLKEGLAELF
jgi:hypothetical protein